MHFRLPMLVHLLVMAFLLLAGPAPAAELRAAEAEWARRLATAPDSLAEALTSFVETQPQRDRPAAVQAVRGWLLARLRQGEGSALVPALLAQSWRQHGRLEDGLPWLLYARVVSLTERSGCTNPNAPEARIRWLRREFQDFDALFRAVAGGKRGEMVAEAVALEATTWPRRRERPSAWLCDWSPQVRRVAVTGQPLFRSLEQRETGRDHDFMGLRRAVQQMAGTEPLAPR